MQVWELLAAIDHEMMQMDINFMEWQGHLDMAKMASEGLLMELWTNDDPPKKVTKDVLSQAAGKAVRVMLRQDGAWNQVGTGMINANGDFTADITGDVPDLSLNALRHFSLRKDLPTEPSAYETLVVTPGSGVVEISRVSLPDANPYLFSPPKMQDIMDLPQTKRSIKGVIPDMIENHPFFKDAPGNFRCNECKNHTIHCTCELERPTDAPE